MLLSTALGASTAIAEVVIHEVHIVNQFGEKDIPPEFLVIYGTNFGEDPVINLGTQEDPLDTPEEFQDLCDLGDPPPLGMGFDCVVAELPTDIPDGDYLLWLEATSDVAICDEEVKLFSVEFEFTGGACSDSSQTQEEFNCFPDGAFPGMGEDLVEIVVLKDADKKILEQRLRLKTRVHIQFRAYLLPYLCERIFTRPPAVLLAHLTRHLPQTTVLPRRLLIHP